MSELRPAGDLAELEEECTGCSWPGRCAGYGRPGCRMKAEERLRVDAERTDQRAPRSGAS